MTAFDRKVFFDAIRSPLFDGRLTAPQVSGIEAILDGASKHGIKDVRHLAYCLATAQHETASTMQPIDEYGKGKGKKYGVKGKYGQVPYGRGLVQLTWDYNYERADKELGLGGALLKNFELAKRPDIAVGILFRGMLGGWFTTRKLVHYFSAQTDDPVNARKIVNGTDRAQLIAGYHRSYLAALKAAGWDAKTPSPAPVPGDKIVLPEPTELPDVPDTPLDVGGQPAASPDVAPQRTGGGGAVATAGWVQLLVNFLIALVKRSAK